jgi:GNAT superfamily N-acetyltransferase
MENLQIVPYTLERVEDVLDFERRLREEEDFWGWDIDEAYTAAVWQSFQDPRFSNALSLLAYRDGQVVGRIDATLICTHFDGSVKAYLDWICVLKSQRHRGTAQALMAGLRRRLKEAGADTLIGLIAANPEAQRFYRSLEGAKIQDEGIWIDL